MQFHEFPTIRRGASGDTVKTLQYMLIKAIPQWPEISSGAFTADGSFGPKTEAAVQFFQNSRGLTPDGIVGAQTWAALQTVPGNQVLGPERPSEDGVTGPGDILETLKRPYGPIPLWGWLLGGLAAGAWYLGDR